MSTEPDRRPPRLPAALLAWFLERVGMSELIPDLAESFRERHRADGAFRAASWYWLQLGVVPLSYLRHVALGGEGERGVFRGLRHDVAASLRSARKSPTASLLAVTALGVGIGLTATMYSIVHGVMRDLPLPDPETIVNVERTNPSEGIDELLLNVHAYRDWRSAQTSLVDLGAFYDGTVNVNWGEGTPVSYPNGAFITPNAFEILGVAPVVGRTFLPEENDPAHPPALLISYEVWSNRFDRDPDVVGRPVRVNGEAGQVVGVMPEGFRFPLDQPVWVPLWTRVDPRQFTRSTGSFLHGFGRLEAGVSMDRARQEFDAIAARLAEEYPDASAGVEARIEPYVDQHVDPRIRALFVPMMGAVLFVLLVACGNVANLLVADGLNRRREFATRAALGGTRGRIAALAFARAGVLAAAGTALGVGLTYGLVRLFNRSLTGIDLPYWVDVRADPEVLSFIVLAGLVTTLLAGFLPALRTSMVPPAGVLRDGGRGGPSRGVDRITAGLVVLQVGLSFALLTGTGLVVQSVRQVGTAEDLLPTRILTGRVALFETTHPDDASRYRFLREVERELSALSGVEEAAIAGAIPGDWRGVGYERVAIEGTPYPDPDSRPFVHRVIASPGFFSTFGLHAVSGRVFDERDGEEIRGIVVNESFRERFFPDGRAVGRRIRVDGPGTAMGAWARSAEEWSTVVGVVPDFFIEGLNPRNPGTAGVYVPLPGNTRPFMSVAMRSTGAPGSHAPTLRETVASLNPDIPVYWIRTMEEVLEKNAWLYRVFGTVFVLFGAVALFLALLGVFGVVAQLVRRRRREMSIRLALGACATSLLTRLLRKTAVLVGIGVVLGLALTAALGGHLQGLLFETSPRSPTLLAGAVVVLAVGAVVATLVPGTAILRTTPRESLDAE